MTSKKRVRVIDELRKQFPGEWTYDASSGRWHHDGWYVSRCAALASMYDGDDDTFRTAYIRSDTGEELYLAGNGSPFPLLWHRAPEERED